MLAIAIFVAAPKTQIRKSVQANPVIQHDCEKNALAPTGKSPLEARAIPPR
jgi:hypothetical protein